MSPSPEAPGAGKSAAEGLQGGTLQTKDRAKMQTYINHKDIPKRLKLEYSKTIQDPSMMHFERLMGVLERTIRDDLDLRKLLQLVADTIRDSFGIDNVAIGLKSADGMYRYSVLSGFREETAANQMKLAYATEQFFNDDEFNGFALSRYSKIYLAEDNEYKGLEKVSFNRPLLLRVKRKSLTECLEADYVDVFILGPDEELLGWIELSGTKDGRLPDTATIRWVEAAGTLIAYAIKRELPT